MLPINRIHRIDAIEGLKKLPDASVDLVITDPPYNIARKDRQTMKSGTIVSTMDLSSTPKAATNFLNVLSKGFLNRSLFMSRMRWIKHFC